MGAVGMLTVDHGVGMFGDMNFDGELDIFIMGNNQTVGKPRGTGTGFRDDESGAPAARPPDGHAGADARRRRVVPLGAWFDDNTLTRSITYERASAPRPVAVRSPACAPIPNGRRRVARFGSQGVATHRGRSTLFPGSYYYAVQSVDGC